MSNIGNKETLAKNLAYYLEKFNKTQREMAEVVGVAASTFNDWMKAKKYPRIDKIEMLANYFGIKKSDLIEEKAPEQIQVEKKAGVITDATLKMKSDPEFLSLVKKLVDMDSDQIRSVEQLITAFLK